MKTTIVLILASIFAITCISCVTSDTSDEFGIGIGTSIFASSTNLVILKGKTGTSIITGGTEPYTIIEISNGSVVTAQISNRELQINAVGEGTASIKVKDSSSPTKTVTVSVSVKTAYTANTAGSVSFTSNRGDFLVNGIAQYGIDPPSSGSGAIAIQDFGSIMLFAYKVNSSTNIDITQIEFESNTSNYSGTFQYPGFSKVVYISYFPNNNPKDSTYLQSGFILASLATSTIESITSTNVQGTFSGKGYSTIAGGLYLNDKIEITGGTFNVPLIQIGGAGGKQLDKNVLCVVEKIFRQHKRK